MRAKIKYWEKWGGSEFDAMAAVVRAFNESQQDFEVDLTSTGDWASSADVDGFLGAEQKGRGPDLIGLEVSEIPRLAAIGVLRPIGGTAVERIGALLRDDVAGLGVWHGERYAIPVVADLVTLYVNQAAARGTPLEQGIPASLHAFDAAIQRTAGREPIPFVPTYPGWWPEAWPFLFGGAWFDAHGRFTPERVENRQAYEWILGLKDRFRLERFAAVPIPFGRLSPEPFFAGEVALVFDGDWLVRRLTVEPRLDWTVAPFPTADGRGGVLLEADLVGIPAGARCPEGAAAFLEFLTQAEWIEHLALGQGKVSPLLAWSPEFVAAHPNPRLVDLRAVWDRAHVFVPPAVPEWWAARERIRDAFRQMWCGGVPPHSALARLAEVESPLPNRSVNC